MALDSVAYHALRKVKSLFDPRAEQNIFLFSYRHDEHFSALWSFFDCDISATETVAPIDSTIIIVWDGIPQRHIDTVNTSEYLTPVDWAVGFALAINNKYKSKGLKEYPKLRIVILDLDSTQSSECESIRFLKQSLLPWIKLIQPFRSLIDLDGLSSTMFFHDSLQNELSTMHDTFTRGNFDLDITQNIWAARLTRPSKPGNRHALANIIGPIILMGDDGHDRHVTALRHLITAIGLVPALDKKNQLRESAPWIDVNSSPMKDFINDLGSHLDIILVDDQHKSGWGKMLCWAFGAEYRPNDQSAEIGKRFLRQAASSIAGKVTLKAFPSADEILSKIDGTDKRFRLVLDENNTSNQPEILFLDLRLFSGRNIADEVAFFKKLIPLTRKFKDGDTSTNFPWPGFKEAEEIELVEKWIANENRKPEDDAYILALTFLPRLLALTDLSLPIVLFSSTGRRDIAEMLKPYGNIITAFDKPKLTVDVPDNIAVLTKRKFQEVLEEAFQILQARQKCKIIASIPTHKSLDIDSTEGIHIELFIDECFEETSDKLDNLPPEIAFPEELKKNIYYNDNNKRLIFKGKMNRTDRDTLLGLALPTDTQYIKTVRKLYSMSHDQNELYLGGLFAIFTGEQGKADKFDNDLVTNGVRYFDSFGFGVQPTISKIRYKKESSAIDLTNMMTSSEHKPDYLGFIGLRHLLSNTTSGFDLFNPESADNLYRMALTALLESFLCETLPALFGSMSEKVSVSIFVATKVKPFHSKSEVNNAMFSFGSTFLNTNSGYILYSLNRDAVCPIISDIIDFHHIKRKIHRAIGVKMAYEHARKPEPPEYFICRDCKEMFFVKKDNLPNIAAILKCSCGGADKISPDYRALHYIGDQLLNHIEDIYYGNGYGESVKKVLGGFDDELNDDFKSCINASRLLDSEDVVGAIVKVNADISPCLPDQYKVKPLLLSRLASKLSELKGEAFCTIAERLNR